MTKKLLVLILGSALIFTGCNVNLLENNTEDTEKMITVDKAKEILVKNYGFTEDEVNSFDAYAFVKYCSINETDYEADEVRNLYEEYKYMFTDADYSEMFYIFDATSQEDLEETDEISKIGFDYNYGDNDEKIVIDFENDAYYYDNLSEVCSKSLPENSLKEDIYKICNWKHKVEKHSLLGSTASLGYTIIVETTDGKYCVYDGWAQDSDKFPKGYDDLYDEVHAILE